MSSAAKSDEEEPQGLGAPVSTASSHEETASEARTLQEEANAIKYPLFGPPESNVIQLSPNVRHGNIAGIWPVTTGNEPRQPILEFIYYEAAAYLAMEHFNARSGQVVPELSDLLQNCDFQLSMEVRDTRFNAFQGVKALVEAYSGGAGTVSNQQQLEQEDLDGNDLQTETDTVVVQDGIQSATPIVHDNDTGTPNSPTDSETTIEATTDIPLRTVPPHTIPPSRTSIPLRTDPTRPLLTRRPSSRKKRQRALTAIESNIPTSAPSQETERLIRPFAILGAATSGVTSTVSILGNALQLPQISGTATSASLDDSPLFARTIPTNQGDARAIMMYLDSINARQIGIMYIQDAWGILYNAALIQEAQKFQIEVVVSEPYTYQGDSLKRCLENLDNANVRYFFAVMSPDRWRPVVRMAYEYGIMGRNHYTWYMAEISEIIGSEFALQRETEWDIAQALHGVGILLLHFEDNYVFNQALEDFVLAREEPNALNQTMRDRFIAAHVEREIFENVTFLPPYSSFYMYLMYDAMLALGLTACNTPGFFTADEFYANLLQLEFPGVSGLVQFHNVTGTRNASSVQYRLENVVLSDERSSDTQIKFHAKTSVLMSGTGIEVVNPYQFYDNTTIPAAALPPIEGVNYNLISRGALIFGWTFSGFVLLNSLFWMIWTIINRKKFVVRASQPVFLCQICIGVFIMALSIIPLSMQEESDGGTSRFDLDAACMATPWLIFSGFVTAFSAIFSKTWRLMKLLENSRGMRRIQIMPRHVIGPFVALMTVNCVLLLACTLIAPFQWTRVPVKKQCRFFWSRR